MCSYMLSLKVLLYILCVGSRYSDYSNQTVCHLKICKIINPLVQKVAATQTRGVHLVEVLNIMLWREKFCC